MKRKQNAGVSLVEIVIALAIFMVMIIPIVKGIITSLNRTTDAKELQYRNEFAEAIMEHVKAVDITEITDATYYESIGATDVSASTKNLTDIKADYDLNKDTKEDANDKLTASSYSIKGKVKLGTKKTDYTYSIVVDNSYYVNKKAKDENYVDPNNLALGIVEDIDAESIALIDGTVLNYDTVASDAFLVKKLQKLKDMYPERYEQQISQEQGDSLFIRDTASRLMTIEVSGEKSTGYKVRCRLGYIDHDQSHSVLGSDNYVEYFPYGKDFPAGVELPNIYVMYNPCYYGDKYVADDYVAVDTSGLTDDPEINLFMIETAATYSQSITKAEQELKTEAESNGEDYESIVTKKLEANEGLVNNVSANGATREKVNIHMVGISDRNDASFLGRLHVYHNFMDFSPTGNSKNPDKTDKANVTTNIKKVFYDSSDPNTITSSLTTLANHVHASSKVFALVGDASSATVQYLNSATDNKAGRGLYEVKVYMQKGTGEIDTTTATPILQGTKGGNESK